MNQSMCLEEDVKGVDKVARYGWQTKNEPGKLAWVDKRLLNVDESYQRAPKHLTKIIQIAKEWNWVSLAAIVVAKRPDGKLFVVDGQHRALAAMKRSDVQSLPCIVHNITHVSDEAKAFIESNAGRKPVTAMEQHKAKLLSGCKIAAELERLMEEGGKKFATGGSSADGLKCVSVMNRLIARNHDELLAIWPLVCSLTRGTYMSERIIEGLVYIQSRMPDGESLSDSRWAKRLESIGINELEKAAAEGAAFFSKGGAKAWAVGMVNRLNKGLQKKLEI